MDNSILPDPAEGTTEEVVKSNTEEVESAVDNNDKPADPFAENDANDGQNAEKETESLDVEMENSDSQKTSTKKTKNDEQASAHESDNENASDDEMEDDNQKMSRDAALVGGEVTVLREIKILGNNLWNVFFKFADDNADDSKETGFFEIRVSAKIRNFTIFSIL